MTTTRLVIAASGTVALIAAQGAIWATPLRDLVAQAPPPALRLGDRVPRARQTGRPRAQSRPSPTGARRRVTPVSTHVGKVWRADFDTWRWVCSCGKTGASSSEWGAYRAEQAHEHR